MLKEKNNNGWLLLQFKKLDGPQTEQKGAGKSFEAAGRVSNAARKAAEVDQKALEAAGRVSWKAKYITGLKQI